MLPNCWTKHMQILIVARIELVVKKYFEKNIG